MSMPSVAIQEAFHKALDQFQKDRWEFLTSSLERFKALPEFKDGIPSVFFNISIINEGRSLSIEANKFMLIPKVEFVKNNENGAKSLKEYEAFQRSGFPSFIAVGLWEDHSITIPTMLLSIPVPSGPIKAEKLN